MHQDEMVDMDRLALEESESRFASFVAQAGEAYAELYRDTQTQDRRGPGESPPTMSLLRRRQTKSNLSVKLVTQ